MKKRLLVIEDDDALARKFRAALCVAGFDVDVSGDGLTALEDIDQDHPDLVILDLHLPQIGGETILSEVLATPDTRDIPVIVVTGSDGPCTMPQASAILRKSCDPSELVAMVEKHLH